MDIFLHSFLPCFIFEIIHVLNGFCWHTHARRICTSNFQTFTIFIAQNHKLVLQIYKLGFCSNMNKCPKVMWYPYSYSRLFHQKLPITVKLRCVLLPASAHAQKTKVCIAIKPSIYIIFYGLHFYSKPHSFVAVMSSWLYSFTLSLPAEITHFHIKMFENSEYFTNLKWLLSETLNGECEWFGANIDKRGNLARQSL